MLPSPAISIEFTYLGVHDYEHRLTAVGTECGNLFVFLVRVNIILKERYHYCYTNVLSSATLKTIVFCTNGIKYLAWLKSTHSNSFISNKANTKEFLMP